GHILTANQNFLATLGYTLDEVKGKHHSLFVDAAHRASAEYRAFWDKLGRGEYDAGQYRREGKGGKEIWIQASYNPILDMNGKPSKVVKYATDITAAKRAEFELQTVLDETMEVMQGLAAGDLTKSMNGSYTGKFAVLADAVNASVTNLQNVVMQIREA